MPKKPKIKTIPRDSITGRFTTWERVRKDPKETEVEKRPVPSPNPRHKAKAKSRK